MHPSRLAEPALAVATALALGVSCAASEPPPNPPSPIYEWQLDGETTYWRYVPLAPTAAQHPSQQAFADAQGICAGPDAAGCLAGLGFYRAQCSDGLDNDGDGLTDHPADPGCAARHALEEAPACDDDRDNDGDGLADWDGAGFTHPDPECLDAPARDRERGERRRRFGL
jgi:hypothetical protein